MIPTHVLCLLMQCIGEAGESLDRSLQGQSLHVLYLPMQCTGEAGESLDLSLQGQGFLIVLVLDHPLRRLHHLSERDLPSVPQHHAEHVVVLPGKKK